MASGGFTQRIIKDGRDALQGEQDIRGTVGINPDAEILPNGSGPEIYSGTPKSENYDTIPGENGPIMVDKELGDPENKPRYIK
ncbi:MAG: hypothetical protein KAT83_00160 [Candidatus Aenigmarchaeota archaeon]|nr:hypothetical protein [Candidatus Aenigmarchaeota archaeon]